jgi:hypothetical protein
MNSNLNFLALGLLAGPIVASAQTWDYQGALMTGTDTVNLYTAGGGIATTVTPVSEAFSAQFVQSGTSLAYTLDLGNQTVAAGIGAGTEGSWILGPGIIQATYATNGSIDGFTVQIDCNVCKGKESYDFNVTPTGDSYYLGLNNSSAGFTIVGMSNTTAGVWVGPIQTPEIDPAGAASGLALLLGTLMVARGRRPLRLPP